MISLVRENTVMPDNPATNTSQTLAGLILYWRAEAVTQDRRDLNLGVRWVTHGEMLRRCALELETALKGTQL